MPAWVLPDHIADVLPSEARHIEDLRRELLDTARSFGYELVMPPLLGYLDSLLAGTAESLDLQTFKLVDQLSGRTMGLRADTTPQVARIDAHLLNRQGVARLCYCGPVLHARPDKPHATREPLQFGAELYGHAGLEADIEALDLALEGLAVAGVREAVLDLADARLLRALLAGVVADVEQIAEVHAALAAKDRAALNSLTRHFPAAAREGLLAVVDLYGDLQVLDEAARVLPAAQSPACRQALADLRALAASVTVHERPMRVRVGFDLADVRGYAYYSGARFSIVVPGASDALVRGGRYDEVGAVFGRNRPAVGFSLDLKELAGVAPRPEPRPAVRAPWGDAPGLREAVARLRAQGETVVRMLPGHDDEIEEFQCDRELVSVNGHWALKAL